MQTDTLEPGAGERLALDPEAVDITNKLGRWLRVTGTIQLALAGMALLFFGLAVMRGIADELSRGLLATVTLLMLPTLAGTYLLQALRIQAAGEQFDNLKNELHADYLELAFGRLRTVFVVELVLGGFWLLRTLLNLLKLGAG